MPYLKKFLLSLLAVILIFEEWLWIVLTALGTWLTQALHLQKIELWLVKAPPNMALVAFAIPILIVSPINLVGLGLIGHGMFMRGLAVELFAKFLGTILIARVFKLTKTQLLTFRWFAWIYYTILGWLNWAHQLVTSTTVYKRAKQFKERFRSRK